jgi:hypothetical protein
MPALAHLACGQREGSLGHDHLAGRTRCRGEQNRRRVQGARGQLHRHEQGNKLELEVRPAHCHIAKPTEANRATCNHWHVRNVPLFATRDDGLGTDVEQNAQRRASTRVSVGREHLTGTGRQEGVWRREGDKGQGPTVFSSAGDASLETGDEVSGRGVWKAEAEAQGISPKRRRVHLALFRDAVHCEKVPGKSASPADSSALRPPTATTDSESKNTASHAFFDMACHPWNQGVVVGGGQQFVARGARVRRVE